MTSDSELFESNLIRWKAFWPEQAALWQLGMRYLEKKNLIQPIEIAQIPPHFDDQAILPGTQALYIFGIGSGHLDPFIIDWLDRSKENQLILLEDDPLVINELLNNLEGEFLLYHPQIWIGFIPPIEKEPKSLEEICKYFFILTSQTLCHQEYRKKFPNRCFEIAAWINGFHHLFSLQANEFHKNASLYENFFWNFSTLNRSKYGVKLKKTFENVPAIVCGAGPSLDKQISLLKESRPDALIFAGGSSLNALNTYNIIPHFAIATDPNSTFFSRQLMNEAYEVPLFYSMRVNRFALRLHVGDLIYLGGDTAHHYVRELINRLGIYKSIIEAGWSVVTNGVSIATALGCDPILVIGSDLSYPSEKSYSRGVRSHPIIPVSSMVTKQSNEELISTQDIYGKPIQTHNRWKGESLWYAQFKNKFPKRTILNCTEGGIGLEGIPNVNFKSALEQLEKTPRDLDGRVNAAIEMAQMPEHVTEEAINDYLFDTETGLMDCQTVIQREGHRYLKFFKMLPQEGPPYLTDEELLDCPAFANDDTYHHYLEIFNRHFLKRHRSKIRRLEIDGETLPAEEFLYQTYEFAVTRYQELFNIVKTHLRILRKFLNEIRNPTPFIYNFKPALIYSEDPMNGADYSFDNHILSICDPECTLNWKDDLSVAVKIESASEYDSKGALRHEAYLLDQNLHGPSSFFDPEGILLSKRWYINGKVQGRALLYYNSGVLKSRQFYKDNLWEGTQYFYHASGTLKSELPYQNGQLHGVVKIYDPEGAIQHEISFEEGKRHGREFYWSAGQIHFEANYELGIPKGTAQRYHSNGNISLKASYDSEGKLLELLKLTPEGLPVDTSLEEISFFDIVSQQSRILSQSLQQVSESLPVIFRLKGGYSESVKKTILNEIGLLQNAISKMQQHADELHRISSETMFGKAEPLWKTPSSELQLQQLMKNLDPLKEQVTLLIQTIEKLKSSMPPPPSP